MICKKLVTLLVCLFSLTSLSFGDVTAFDKPRTWTTPFRSYKQILPQPVPTTLTTVVTQPNGCTSAAGGSAATMLPSCGVYIDMLVISCPSGAAGTVVVQDLQSSPVQLVPLITNTANTLYSLPFPWYWMPGGFKIQQVTGNGCTYHTSFGIQ